VDKWSCLQVIIDFIFEQQQLKPDRVSVCTDAIQYGQPIRVGGVR